NKKVKNIFTDQEIIEAEVKLVEQVVTKYKNHPALYAWDLGNEHSQLHIQVNNQEINKWLNKFTNLIKDIDSDHPTTLGIHQLDIEKDTGFQPQVVSQNCELITMHGYSVYAGWGKGYLDNNVIPFLNYLVSKLSGKRVLFSEFGFATNEQQQPTTEITLTWADNHQQKTYLVAEEEAAKCTIKIIQTLKAMGSLGAFLWCYADYDKSLRKLPPFDRAVQEMSFGITRADGSLKSVARMLKNIQLGEEQNKKKIEILKEKYYQQPLENLMKYYQEYNKDE
ncbi:MAG: cellulase family glycosylhydrolase, partial [Candidatus Margulisbacteria bacterium]|nr:cellulase family glycosylhydrolase [Candidatus Margulisiibacteriota bacterium]